MKKIYSEKLLDPRWQKKRLEVFQRDNFTCLDCESSTKTVHVHHGYYVKNREPWDYPLWSLKTLCEDCHSAEQDLAGKNLQKWEQGVSILFDLLGSRFWKEVGRLSLPRPRFNLGQLLIRSNRPPEVFNQGEGI